MEHEQYIHTWTNGGEEVLILKCVPPGGIVSGTGSDGTGYRFEWPLAVGMLVEAPDWDPAPRCGGGLHGWAWGLAIGDGKEPDWGAEWIVFGAKPEDVVDLGGKVKAKQGVIRFIGAWQDATNFILTGQINLVQERASGAASATGWSGAASATGERGAASATGESGAASATGEALAAVVTGPYGKARARAGGCIALAHVEADGSLTMRCSRIGDGFLQPDTWYGLDTNGDFKEVLE